MKQTTRDSVIIRGVATLAAATGCLLLGSCATDTPPPAGSAIFDAKPAQEHRGRIKGIELVSINGKSVHGSRCVIEPGLNAITTRFRWPQGQDQQVELRFYATPGIVYFINYDVCSLHNEGFSSVTKGILDGVGTSGDPYVAMGAVFLAVPIATIAVGERISHGVTQHGKPATHIDLMVVAHHSSQGIVRQVRAYPDGRVDEKPWADWAQMQAP